MKKVKFLSGSIPRALLALLVLCLALRVILPVAAVGDGSELALGGSEPVAQGQCTLTQVNNPCHSGQFSLFVSNRSAFWHGAKWNVAGALTQSGTYLFTAYVRGDADSAGQTLSYGLNCGGSKWLTVGSAVLSAEEWTRLSGTIVLTQAELDAIAAAGFADLYPLSQAGQYGNYYIDTLSLEQVVYDDMSVCGAAPYAQAAVLQRVSEPACAGNDVLHVTSREAFYGGAAWSIPAASLTSLKENTDWTLSMQLRAASGSMTLAYNIEFWYTDGTPNKYLTASAAINDAGWTTLTGRFQVSADYLTDALERIVLYPSSGEGELGDYYADAVSLTGAPAIVYDDMTLCGAQPYAQGGTLTRVNDPVFAGNDALLAADRTNVWDGVAWSIPASQLGDLTKNSTWTLSMQLRCATQKQQISYNLEFWYSENVSDCKYLSCSVEASPQQWTLFSGVFEVPASYFEKLDHLVIYPCTGEGQLDAYYLDAVSLSGKPAVVRDDMRIGGNDYFIHGDGSLLRVTQEHYAGSDALLATERTLPYSGAGWDVKALLESGGIGTWRFTAYVKTVDSYQHLSYNIYLRYTDGRENWLRCGEVYMNSNGWSCISGAAYCTTNMAMSFDNLEMATLYPCTDEGQLGAYYIDSPSLVRTGDAIPLAPAAVTPSYDYDYFPRDGGFETSLNLGTVGYAFAHGAPCTLRLTSDEAYEGKNALLVENRSLPYSGAGYDVTSYFKNQGWGNWFFHAYAKAVDEPVNLHYCIYLLFEDGTEDWLQPAMRYLVTADEWSPINTDFADGDALMQSGSGVEHDFSKLKVATLYPCTGENELGAYYLDDVKLYKGADDYTAPTFHFDTFPLDGSFEEELYPGAPGHIFTHGEGAALTRTDEDAHSGSYCLKVSEKQSSYSGAGWVVTDYLKQEGWGDWYFSCYAKSAGGEVMFLQYSIYLRFADGTEHWMNCGMNTAINGKTWMGINTDTAGNAALFRSDDGAILDFSELEYAVLYPNLDNGEGDYYIDDARLWREKPAEDESGDDTPVVIVPPDSSPAKDASSSEKDTTLLWPWIVAGGVLLAAGCGFFFLKMRKKRT